MTVAEAEHTDLMALVEKYKETIGAIVKAKQGDDKEMVGTLTTTGLAQLVQVRAKWTDLCWSTEEAINTDADRVAVEKASVQLQNANFTRSWLARMISTNMAHKFSDADLALRPLPEFESALALEERQALAAAVDHEHAVMLARLTKEKDERAALQAQLEELSAIKSRLLAENERKRKRLTRMGDHVGALQRTVAPTLSDLGLSHEATAATNPAALQRLPLPLYVLHSQLVAANAAFDLDVKISLSAAAAAKGESSGAGAMIAVVFAYAPGVHVVTASARDPHHTRVLDSLYLNDTGSCLPHDAGSDSQAAGAASGPALLAPLAGKPYKWCQPLAGLDLLLPPPQEGHLAAEFPLSDPITQLARYREERRAVNFIERLRKRMQESTLLTTHLSRLSKLLLPEASGTEGCGSARLTAWKEVRSIVTTTASAMATAEEEGELDDEAPPAGPQGTPPASDEQLTALYTGTMQVGPADAPITVAFECSVGMFYPSTPPVLRITRVHSAASPTESLMADDKVKEIEAAVNEGAPALGASDPLPAQLSTLAQQCESLVQSRRDVSSAVGGDAAPMEV